MYKQNQIQTTSLTQCEKQEGETIEQKVQRIMNNKEPITDGAPIIFTERKDGVNPAHDIRTDRFELAIEATDKITKSHRAKREERHKEPEKKDDTTTNKPDQKPIGGPENIATT